MKITRTPIHYLLSIVCCCLFSILTIDMTAQANASVAPVPPINTEDYPGPKWKSPADYALVLETEKTNTTAKLADPNLDQVQLGNYTGYARMINYMLESLTNQEPIGEIAIRNYERVLSEAASDPIIKHMSAKDFGILYDALLPKLIKS